MKGKFFFLAPYVRDQADPLSHSARIVDLRHRHSSIIEEPLRQADDGGDASHEVNTIVQYSSRHVFLHVSNAKEAFRAVAFGIGGKKLFKGFKSPLGLLPEQRHNSLLKVVDKSGILEVN